MAVQTGLNSQINWEQEKELYWIAKDIAIGRDGNPKDSLWEYDRPHLNYLKSIINLAVKKHVFSLISEAQQLNIEPDYVMAWANIKEPGESIEAHAHNDASLTATYYIRAKENSGDLVLLSTENIIDDKGAFVHNDKSELKDQIPLKNRRNFTPGQEIKEESGGNKISNKNLKFNFSNFYF